MPISVIPVYTCQESTVFRLGKLVKLTLVLEAFRVRFEIGGPGFVFDLRLYRLPRTLFNGGPAAPNLGLG